MADLNTQDVRGRTLVALFDSRDAADRAVGDLEAAGIPRQHITRTENDTASAGDTAAVNEGKGFWDELKSLFIPDDDRFAYSEGVRRGGFLVSVQTDEANYTRVMDILDHDGAVDLDAREQTWRSEGWTGHTVDVGGTTPAVPTAAYAASGIGSATREAPATMAPVGSSMVADAAGKTAVAASDVSAQDLRASAAKRSDTVEAGRDEVIPLYEEQLRVGKRDISHGRVRLRSYVVETPVSEQVGLRQEQVSVERRPVDRPVTDVSGDVFRERVIEAEERGEEAVIGKDVRVREEIALRKDAEQRSETVSDTVRRTEVEVEDERDSRRVGGVSSATGSTGFASQIAERMEVIGSDGQKVGVVDHLDGTDRIKLTKNASPDGQHHFIPLAWVDHVDAHVHLKRTSMDARSAW